MLRKEVCRKLDPNLIKATQAILCTGQKCKISLGTWSQGIDKETSEVLIFIPEEALSFYKATEFLRCLKEAWSEFGFYIIEESTDKNYNCIRGTISSLCFRLRPVA